jgi:hypothetical protein
MTLRERELRRRANALILHAMITGFLLGSVFGWAMTR